MEDEKGNVITGNTHPVTGDGPYTVCFPLEYKIKDKGKLTIDVVFVKIDISLLRGMPIMSDLKGFSEMAVRIVQLLESL